MSSDDVESPPPFGAGRPGRPRRVLGRGPGAAPAQHPSAQEDDGHEPAGQEAEPVAEPEPEARVAQEQEPSPPGETEIGSTRDPEPASAAHAAPEPASPASVPADAAEPASEPPATPTGAAFPAPAHAVQPAPEPAAGPEPAANEPAAHEPAATESAAAETSAAPGPVPDVAAPGESPQEAADDGVFKVRLVNFEGPFDLLLQLISKHKLDVTEVALSKVTDEFMAHIRAMGPDWDLDQTTEFLVVAATLLDLKAARLLPAAEVEDEADLALLEARDLLFARLLQYRAYKRIVDIFTERLDAEAHRHPRTVGLEPHHAELLPEVVISIGPEGFAKLAVKAMQPKPEPQVYVDHIHAPLVSVVEQAGVVVARLRSQGEASFRALVADAADTLTVVARFLALLELYREKAVALDQEEALGELMVRWTGGEGDVRPRVTDEFDRAPDPIDDKDGSKDGDKPGGAAGGRGGTAKDGNGGENGENGDGEDTV